MWNYFKKSIWEPKEPKENERVGSLKRAGMPITTGHSYHKLIFNLQSSNFFLILIFFRSFSV